jgi:hypothetical protein
LFVSLGQKEGGLARLKACVQAAAPQRTPADKRKLQNSSALTVTHGRPRPSCNTEDSSVGSTY